LRSFIEKIITLGKEDNLTNRRKLITFLQDQKAVEKILTSLGLRYKERPGGYTRIIKLGQRKGDAAKMAMIEFV
ncbi:MAG: 50S ribosomal protein L17, partial [Patescibacteria group bacterium]